MILDFLLSNFEILLFFAICFLVLGFILLFFFQSLKFKEEKDIAIEYVNDLNNFNKEIKEYLSLIGNFLEQQKMKFRKFQKRLLILKERLIDWQK